MIKVEKMNFAFEKERVIKNFSYQFKEGNLTSILGPNGSGKTTIIKLMMKFLKGKGSVSINGTDIKTFKTKEYARKVAYVPQLISFPESTSVEEFIEYGRNPHNNMISIKTQEDKDKIEYAIKVCGIEHLRKKDIQDLSGGQRQICAIALTIAQDSDIIILDEPNSYLDIFYVATVMDLLKKLKTEFNKTIILSIHDINNAAKYSDDIILMKKGEIIKHGCPSKVVTEANLRQAYNVNAAIKTIKKIPVVMDYERSK